MGEVSLKDKVAIVTGSGSGIGLEIAKMLIANGAAVVINDVDGDVLEKATGEINKGGDRCKALAGDAGDLACIDALVQAAVENFGQLDLVIANAGTTTFGDFLEYSEKDFQKLINLNLQGSFFLAQRGAREMIKQKSGGRILMLSSTTGHRAHPNLAAYGMTKAALEMLARSLAVELGPFGINVNAIAPGAVMTERTKYEDPNYQTEWENVIPNRSVGSTVDIANAAIFLLSDQARHINGQSILIDGGWTGYSPNPDYLSHKK